MYYNGLLANSKDKPFSCVGFGPPLTPHYSSAKPNHQSPPLLIAF